jgi:tetratricopeptide (TPR) repeat protein
MLTSASTSYRAGGKEFEPASAEPSPAADVALSTLELATGQDACERLLSIDGLPLEVDAQTRRRMADLAPALAAVAPSLRSKTVHIPMPGGWSIHGASIVRADDGFRVLAQSANVRRNENLTRTIHDARGIARARNHWVELDAELRLGAVHGIHEYGLRAGAITTPASGLLHGRPFFRGGRWWIVGAIGDAEAEQTALPLLGWLDETWLRDTSILKRNAGPDPRWNPIVGGDGEPVRFLAAVFPTIIWRMQHDSRVIEAEYQHAAPLIARRLVGATQVIPAAGGFLGLAHELVGRDDDGQRIVHRWLWFDEALCLARLSRPFVLDPICFAAAAGLTRNDDALVISAVRRDGEVWLGSVPEAEVTVLLAPPLALDLEPVERQLRDELEPASPPPARSRRIPARTPRQSRPMIAAMTISGSNRDIIGDALRSVVDWVDWCVLIDTGIQDDTIDIAREIAGDKLIVREFPWCNDFSAARNFALAAAADTGATWAVFIDTDERLVLNGVDIHDVLARSPELALLVPLDSGEYTKDRFFRLPVTGRFRGPTHEAFYITYEIGGGTVTIPGVVFAELPKSPERLRRKDERDRDVLARYTKETPGEPRWFFYYGDVLSRLGQYEEAVKAFRACYALRGWEEESAWAMYRATQCLFELDRLEEALETIVLGMARHAALADFPWFAAFISLRLGRPQQAVYWARHAIALGCFAGIGQTVLRTGWRYPFALWEGPYDVLRVALKELGDDQGAAEAERLFAEAAAARLAQPGNV